MPSRNINTKLNERDIETLDGVRDAMGLESRSSAVRHVIRLARVIYDPDLSITEAFKDHLRDHLNKPSFRDEFPLFDALKTIPKLEKKLGLSNNET